MQNNPNALSSFTPQREWSDPMFEECYLPTCAKTYGLVVHNTTYLFNYGAGLYSFFNNYDTGCLITENCQQYMVQVDASEAVYLFGLSTKAAQTMVEVDGVSLIAEGSNVNTFCRTLAVFEYP